MDKGIRPAAIVKFVAALATRVNTREGNTMFRKGIIAALEEEYGCTHAAGATHYNHAFIKAKEKAETDADLAVLLVGLGRADDKKGGRKPRAVAAAAVTPVPANALLENFRAAGVPGLVAPAVPVTPVDTAPVEPVVQLFDVFKSTAGTLVAAGVTREAADQLVARAAAAKKAKLEVRAAAE